MKILLAHCRYQKSGGEDTVFDCETAQLERAGHEVKRLVLLNDSIAGLSPFALVKVAASTVWSRASNRLVRDTINKFLPDIVHFHNTFPLFSPSVYFACWNAKTPVVQTLHNYRLLCANAMFLRAGRVCEDCSGGKFYNGFRHGCYRDSMAASAPVVGMQYVHHALGSFAHKIDRFIALTEFARNRFVAGGLPASRLVVKANSLDVDPGVGQGGGSYALFVGRLVAEKGVLTLLEAWRSVVDVPLIIVGDGPLLGEVRSIAARMGDRITVLGGVPRSEILGLMGNARALIVPSQWYEGFPMTVVEAYSRGLPVLAAAIGSLDEVVEEGVTGRHFKPGDAADLARVVTETFQDADALTRYRMGARARFATRYSPENNTASLLAIYKSAVEQRRANHQ